MEETAARMEQPRRFLPLVKALLVALREEKVVPMARHQSSTNSLLALMMEEMVELLGALPRQVLQSKQLVRVVERPPEVEVEQTVPAKKHHLVLHTQLGVKGLQESPEQLQELLGSPLAQRL